MLELSDEALDEIREEIQHNVSENDMDISFIEVVGKYATEVFTNVPATALGNFLLINTAYNYVEDTQSMVAAAAVGAAIMYPAVHLTGIVFCTTSRERSKNPFSNHCNATILWNLKLLRKLALPPDTVAGVISSSVLKSTSSIIYNLTGAGILGNTSSMGVTFGIAAAAGLGNLVANAGLGVLYLIYKGLSTGQINCYPPQNFFSTNSPIIFSSSSRQRMGSTLSVQSLQPMNSNTLQEAIPIDIAQIIRDHTRLEANLQQTTPAPTSL